MNRAPFTAHALEAAPQLLGSHLTVAGSEGEVTIRITEVEAYHGVGVPGPRDAGSHSRDRKTERNASMFGPPGHAYVYLSYGMHFALNMVCSPTGTASGVLIRSGTVVGGDELARRRRTAKRDGRPLRQHELARGPGNLATALGITRPEHDGLDLFSAPFAVELPLASAEHIESGPRVGVAGEAGGPAFPWRFWVPGEASVSAFRPGRGAPRH